VIDGPVAEEVACREADVPRADDNRGKALDGWTSVLSGACAPASRRAAAQATSTVTFVGLVRASNTAERFWDWATSASISCRDASASMVNVTLMSL
jgi:hypothetical protein